MMTLKHYDDDSNITMLNQHYGDDSQIDDVSSITMMTQTLGEISNIYIQILTYTM